MAEDAQGPAAPQPPGSTEADAAAIALALGSAGRERADEYLARQSRLAELRIEYVAEQDKFELSHLRYREWSDVARFTLQAAAGIFALLLLFGIGAALWSASHDKALVIEPFSVPPDLASRGLTGQAVAAQLLDKLQAMQSATDSARPASSYTNNWGNDIKVEIPDTGISLGEVHKLLVSWLGNETHISGEVWHTAKGLAVAARVDGQGGGTATGSDFDKLLQQAAEKVYERTQPYRYAAYIAGLGRRDEARAVFRRMAVQGSTPRERAWAYLGLGLSEEYRGHLRRGTEDLRKALAQDPRLALAMIDIVGIEGARGHDEAVLAAARRAIAMLGGRGDVGMSDRARTISLPSIRSTAATAVGDFQAALAADEETAKLPDYSLYAESARADIPVLLARMHDGGAARRAWSALPSLKSDQDSNSRAASAFIMASGKFTMSYWLGDWRALPADEAQVDRIVATLLKKAAFAGAPLHERQIWPFEAQGLAMTGDFKGAHALIDKTPADCFDCLRIRGDIDAAERNWGGANYWFARAVAFAPSIPLGYAEWGRMLLAKGDYDGAIARFAKAHDKGPHFADPLEGWGEALIAKNRSDLALAKFKEAARYAPNWGRLHLKWGEALTWSGDKAGAQRQFALAASLDLTPAEKSQLARMRARHG